VSLLTGTPATRTSSSQYAVEYIRDLIFDGKLRPGDRVPQEEVAQVLHLSRIPVREAIITLTSEGFLRSELHRGAFVEPLDEQSIRDQYALYGIIFGLAAERALERDPAEFLPRLEQLLSRMEETDDHAEFGELMLQFHRALVDAAASPRISVVVRSMPALRPSALFDDSSASVSAGLEGARGMVAALKAGDKLQVTKACAAGMAELAEAVIDLFRARGLFSAPAS